MSTMTLKNTQMKLYWYLTIPFPWVTTAFTSCMSTMSLKNTQRKLYWYLTISFPWVPTAFTSCCSLKLRRLTLSGSTLKQLCNPPFGLPAWTVIRRLYSGAACWCNLASTSSVSSSSWWYSSFKSCCQKMSSQQVKKELKWLKIIS